MVNGHAVLIKYSFAMLQTSEVCSCVDEAVLLLGLDPVHASGSLMCPVHPSGLVHYIISYAPVFWELQPLCYVGALQLCSTRFTHFLAPFADLFLSRSTDLDSRLEASDKNSLDVPIRPTN